MSPLQPLHFSFSEDARLRMPKDIAVAWSGGADSTALLLQLIAEGYAVSAWHINHNWHEDSSDTTLSLSEQAKAWGIPFYTLNTKKPERNLEAEARFGRYAAFEALAEQTGCFHLALGHQADDQAETVCMRLLQGSGVAGCRGMKVYRKHNQLHLWRPMLHMTRQNLELFLNDQGASWVDDPSNEDCNLWRNKIRRKLFPAIEKEGVDAKGLFLRWQVQAQSVQQHIEVLAEGISVEKHSFNEQVYCALNWDIWCKQAKPVRAFLLQKMIGLLFADGRVLGRRHILAIEQWKEHGGHSWLNLSGCCLYRQGQSLQLCQGNTSLRSNFVQHRGKHE